MKRMPKKIGFGMAFGALAFLFLVSKSFAQVPPGGPPPSPDQTPPTATTTYPVNNQTVSSTITISGTAADDVAVASVAVSIDGGAYANASGTTAWTYVWNTTSVANGSHTIEAQAIDTSGNTGLAPVVTVNVSNSGGGGTQPPTAPTNLAVTGTTTSTVSLGWTASNAGTYPIAGYQVFRCTGVCTPSVQVATSTGTGTMFTDVGLAASTTYSYSIDAYDTHGNVGSKSSVVQGTTRASSDTQPPTVSITYPTSGATVSSTITVTATASDNVGVVKVEFYLDGFLQFSTTTPPYYWIWDTASTANGSHTLSAKAYDAAGNVGTSADVPITVNNPTLSRRAIQQIWQLRASQRQRFHSAGRQALIMLA